MGLVIEALDAGRIGQLAGELMTRAVISLEDDMPLAFATTYFNRYKYGRFPVLDRDGRLVGIVSASDIIRALLVAMNKEVERLEERLSAANPAVDSRRRRPRQARLPGDALRFRERRQGQRRVQEGAQGPRRRSRI